MPLLVETEVYRSFVVTHQGPVEVTAEIRRNEQNNRDCQAQQINLQIKQAKNHQIVQQQQFRQHTGLQNGLQNRPQNGLQNGPQNGHQNHQSLQNNTQIQTQKYRGAITQPIDPNFDKKSAQFGLYKSQSFRIANNKETPTQRTGPRASLYSQVQTRQITNYDNFTNQSHFQIQTPRKIDLQQQMIVNSTCSSPNFQSLETSKKPKKRLSLKRGASFLKKLFTGSSNNLSDSKQEIQANQVFQKHPQKNPQYNSLNSHQYLQNSSIGNRSLASSKRYRPPSIAEVAETSNSSYQETRQYVQSPDFIAVHQCVENSAKQAFSKQIPIQTSNSRRQPVLQENKKVNSGFCNPEYSQHQQNQQDQHKLEFFQHPEVYNKSLGIGENADFDISTSPELIANPEFSNVDFSSNSVHSQYNQTFKPAEVNSQPGYSTQTYNPRRFALLNHYQKAHQQRQIQVQDSNMEFSTPQKLSFASVAQATQNAETKDLAGSLDLIYENLKSKVGVEVDVATGSLPRNHRLNKTGKLKIKIAKILTVQREIPTNYKV